MSIDNGAVCAVVVSYHPDKAGFAALLTAILPQVGGIVIVNNGPAGTIAAPAKSAHSPALTEVLDMQRNVGVAAAQNRGIEWARRHGFSHVILFDQDSEPAVGMVQKLLAAWTSLTQSGVPIAAVGPKIVDRRDGHATPFVTFGALSVKRASCEGVEHARTDFLVSSGMLAAIDAYEKVGMLDEALFIDNVDLDWCFRARAKGLGLYGVCEAKLLHQIGDEKICTSILGRSYVIYRHQPLRQYYIMRNRILLYRRAHSPYSWIAQDMFRAFGKGLITLVFFSQRRLTFRMMFNGLVDGVCNRSGECLLSR